MHPDLVAGREALEAGRLDEARGLLENVPAGDPAHAQALRELVRVHAARGDHAATEDAVSRLIALRPEREEVRGELAELYIVLGWTQYLQDRALDAELNTLRALELQPDSVHARYNLGLYRLVQGDRPRAIQAYARAMDLDAAMRYVTRARENLAELREERPDFADVHYALAFFANSLRDRESEVEALERYLELMPDGPASDQARKMLAEARAELEN